MKTKTELCEIFEAKDDEAFTKQFRRDFTICIGIGLLATLGLITSIVHADKIDSFVGNILKALFI